MLDGPVGEVISVVHRRRRWTLEQKLALVEEALRPGVSVAALADRHGVSRSLLFDWRRQAREGTMPGLVGPAGGAVFAPVTVMPAMPAAPAVAPAAGPVSPSRPPALGKPRAAMVEVLLTKGRVLRVPELTEPGWLGRLAAALDA